MKYIPNTPQDREEMLEEIGASSIEELFSDIPAEILNSYQGTEMEPLSEPELEREFRQIADRNGSFNDRTCLLGGGVYNHYIPAVVSHVISRSEFATSYTPYQAEASQGTLTWMFEFQTEIAELTGMDIANSSMYDGASAAAEAVLLSLRVREGGKILVSSTLNPYHRKVIETYLQGLETDLQTIPSKEGRIDREYLSKYANDSEDIASIVIQNPNYLGIVEDLRGVKETIGESLLIVDANPISLGLLEPPGNFGADVTVGEGQPLGNPLNFGGPLLGFFATKREYLRDLPGRVSGQTTDRDGDTGYVMALQTREQHIRRERATSNICTNQALNALAATVYLAALGPDGLSNLARINWDRAHYLAAELTKLDGIRLQWDRPFFNEFLVHTERDPSTIWQKLKENGFDVLHPRYLCDLALDSHLLFAVTETVAKEDLDDLLTELKELS